MTTTKKSLYSIVDNLGIDNKKIIANKSYRFKPIDLEAELAANSPSDCDGFFEFCPFCLWAFSLSLLPYQKQKALNNGRQDIATVSENIKGINDKDSFSAYRHTWLQTASESLALTILKGKDFKCYVGISSYGHRVKIAKKGPFRQRTNQCKSLNFSLSPYTRVLRNPSPPASVLKHCYNRSYGKYDEGNN